MSRNYFAVRILVSLLALICRPATPSGDVVGRQPPFAHVSRERSADPLGATCGQGCGRHPAHKSCPKDSASCRRQSRHPFEALIPLPQSRLAGPLTHVARSSISIGRSRSLSRRSRSRDGRKRVNQNFCTTSPPPSGVRSMYRISSPLLRPLRPRQWRMPCRQVAPTVRLLPRPGCGGRTG